MIKRAPKKPKSELETNQIKTYLNDQDYKEFLKKAKKDKYPTQAACLRDIVLNYLGVKF